MAAIQVNMRVPEVLLARINGASGSDRTAWILEACRMRLDGAGRARASDVKTGNAGGDDLKVTLHAGQQTPDGTALIALRAVVAQIEARPFTPESFIVHGTEIPICGKTWWEGGDQYECLMDKGHKNPKHGIAGMVRKLDQ